MEIKIKGKAELERAFKNVRKEVLTELRPALRVLAEPVKKDAAAKASSSIPNIGQRWARMRVGVVAKGVYVAPASRNSGGSKRPNLAGLLLARSLQPAVDENREAVMAGLDVLVRESAARNGFL